MNSGANPDRHPFKADPRNGPVFAALGKGPSQGYDLILFVKRLKCYIFLNFHVTNWGYPVYNIRKGCLGSGLRPLP